MILINGIPENRISVSDRGLQYGDGLFETLAYRHGHIEMWPEHLARLLKGCERLKIAFSNQQQNLLRDELTKVTASLENDAVIKIIITRGQGGRGYRPDLFSDATRIISSHPMPEYPDEYQQGIRIRFCDQVLSQNPTLAGLKHLNRLEQVLARSEWDNKDIIEGLMMNAAGEVVEGTMSNVFIVKQGKLITPELKQAGVEGIMRQCIMKLARDNGLDVEESIVSRESVVTADEVFLTNSIIKVWPVKSIAEVEHAFEHGPITQLLQNRLEARL